MYQIKYECGYELHTKAGHDVGRVVNSNGQTVYEGTFAGAEKYLADRSVLAMHKGDTNEERQQS